MKNNTAGTQLSLFDSIEPKQLSIEFPKEEAKTQEHTFSDGPLFTQIFPLGVLQD